MQLTEQKKQFLGLILVIIASFCYGSNATLAKMNFMNGGDTFSFLIVRFVVSALVLTVFWKIKRSGPSVTFRQALVGMGLGILIFIISFCFTSATQFIPAGLVTVLLFTFPLWIGVLAWVTGEEEMGPLKTICLISAFAGLVLCVGAQFAASWEGITLGLLAAFFLAINVFYGNRFTKHVKSLDLTFLMMWGCALACIPWLMVDTPTFPENPGGIINLFGAALLFVAGLFCFFYGMPFIGAVKASLYNNVEPLFSLGLAYIILGETLTHLQLAGALIVLSSLIGLQIFTRKNKEVPVAEAL